MDNIRRTSVYDLTSLRLHPDGLRVHQTEKNLGFDNYRHSIQDSQRQWIADDAGGSYEVPMYMHLKPSRSPSEDEYVDEGEVDEDEDEDEDEDGEEEAGRGKSVSRKGKRKQRPKSFRPIKRKKFREDDSYLSAPLGAGSNSNNGLPEMPSQDLLKNIHQFAAKYYDERGLLIDASKRYRLGKRMRQLRETAPSPSAPPEDTSSSQDLPEDEDGQARESEQAVTESDGREKRVTRDMYRVLDGSVLLAIGVLTQELVKKLISSRKTVKAPPPDDVGETRESEDEDDAKLLSLRYAGSEEVEEDGNDVEEEGHESEDEGF